MPETELPALVVGAVAAIVATSRPLLTNRDPSPGETGVPLVSVIALDLVEPGADGVDRAATRVWVDGVLAFDGVSVPPVLPAFAGPQATVIETADTLRIVLDPLLPFASQARVTVRASSSTRGSVPSLLDEAYAFEIEDRTAPRLVAGIATDARSLRLVFDEDVMVVDASAITLTAIDTPAVPLHVVGATAASTLVDVTVSTEMTPDARYRVVAAGVADVDGNPTTAPYMELVVTGYRPPRPARRRFDLWSMLPKHNRRSDTTGDLARFIACLQEITDLLLADIDRYSDIFDLERAPAPFLELILRDLGNPFPFDLGALGKRRLAAVLVEMYRQKGTAPGIRNAIRFFLGVDIVAITGLAESALVLGESELGVDWELGPSDRFARYAFSIVVARALSPTERKQLRAIVGYLKPAHTHFVDLVEPTAPFIANDWEIGVSELGIQTLLH
jgi:phage tail-like protein